MNNPLKRKNKSKEEISQQLANDKKVAHIKDLVRIVFPVIENMDTVYEAQTTVNALSGFIEAEIEKIAGKVKLSEIEIDLSKEEEGSIKTALTELVALFPDESAQELAETMERLGTTLQAFVSNNAMKEKMTITVDDIVSK